MANYNPFPAVYNPYMQNVYPQNGYGQPYSQTAQPQYQQPGMGYAQGQQPKGGMEWVDGEVGAKAFQLPVGWPANVPFPLWDTNDPVIYLKSINAMGMPNPLQRVHYTTDEPARTAPMTGNQSADAAPPSTPPAPDLSVYVRRDELEQVVRDELRSAMTNQQETKGARSNGKSAV